jgi:hypothetical protein
MRSRREPLHIKSFTKPRCDVVLVKIIFFFAVVSRLIRLVFLNMGLVGLSIILEVLFPLTKELLF